MVKRAALARALALDPPLLFLDEPTSGLDPIGAQAFDDLVKYLQRELQLTVVMITHDLDTLFGICTRVGVLVDGRMISDTLANIARNPQPWIHAYFQGPRAQRRRVRSWSVKPITSPSAPLCCWSWSWAALFVYWYSDSRDQRDFKRYEIYFDGSVSGLAVGGQVRYLGVDVGRVVRVTLDQRAADRVQVIVDIDASAPDLRSHAGAAVARRGSPASFI